MFKSIFRDRALAQRTRQEPLDDRLQITAPHEWLLLAGLGVTFAALLLVAVFGRVERNLSFEAVLVHPGQRHVVAAPVSGTVTRVLAEVGDVIEPGQPLARVRTPSTEFRESLMLRLGDSLLQGERGPDSAAVDLLRALVQEPDGVAAASRDHVTSPYGGEVVSLELAPGQPLLAGQEVALVRAAGAGPLEVLAFVSPEEAALVDAGMEAQVRLAGPGEPAGSGIAGYVDTVSAHALAPPEWLPGTDRPSLERSHLLRVRLTDDWPEPPAGDGAAVSLGVVLGRSSFMALLAPGRRD